MGVRQKTVPGSIPRISCVVSKSDRDHRTATTDNRNLGLTPAGTISHSNLSLSLYPIHSLFPVICGGRFLGGGGGGLYPQILTQVPASPPEATTTRLADPTYSQ